jgi:hypothetical protein
MFCKRRYLVPHLSQQLSQKVFCDGDNFNKKDAGSKVALS